MGVSFFSGYFTRGMVSCCILGVSEIASDSFTVFTVAGKTLSKSIPRTIINMGPLIMRINLFFEITFGCVWGLGVPESLSLGFGGAVCVAPTSFPNS